MGSSYFRFKQFVVNQENVAMRVNTDGVLLGAWLPLGAAAGRSGTDGISPSAFPSEVLDVGTGTGVIALIMAQRLSAASAVSASSTVSTDSLPGFGNADSRPFSSDLAKRLHITAIDIDKESCMQAEENFAASPWSSILESRHISLQEYVRLCKNKMCAAGEFDLIVTNPPYFVNSLKASGERRNGARHNDTLPYRDLAAGVVALLKDSGSFSLILPYAEFGTFEKAANSSYLFVRTRCDVYAREGDAAPKRVMAEFVKGLPSSRTSETLVIQDSNGLTPEYKAITGDFYL